MFTQSEGVALDVEYPAVMEQPVEDSGGNHFIIGKNLRSSVYALVVVMSSAPFW